MQQTTGVAVLATNLAQTDRRALSQAWYSALRLAERTGGPPSAPRPTLTPLPPGAAPRPRVFARGAHGGGPAQSASHARTAGDRQGAVGGVNERRATKSPLAHRIERVLKARVSPGGFASFALRAGEGRIRLLVRSEGERTRVVAVCAPALRERVERALAQARYAMAAHAVRGGTL